MKPVSHWGWFAVLWLGRARVRVWDLRLDAQLATFLSSGYSCSVTVPVSHKFPTVGPCEVGQDGALVLLGLMAEYLAELDPLQAEVKAQWATAASALRFFVSLLVQRCFFSLLSCHSCWHCDKPGFGSVERLTVFHGPGNQDRSVWTAITSPLKKRVTTCFRTPG